LSLSLDLEWKVLYVGSAQDASRDQVLDEILVGPVPVGTNKFVLQADAPDPSQLPPEDLLGVTVVLVTCSYKEREFVRVGYYVNNEYHDPNAPPVLEGEEPPAPPQPIPLEFIQRHILADKPRVTKFPISWGDELTQQQQQQQQTQQTPPTLTQQQQPPQLQTPSGIVSMQEESNLSAVAMAE
jgi:histone chaperone ASF1